MHSALYAGSLSHRRHVPRPHSFRYGVFMVLLDLDELARVFRGRWLWSTSRRALARFDRADHFGDPSIPLADAVRRLVREQTGSAPTGPIRLLTNLRYFGYVFNPVSFYFCFDESGAEIRTVVAEVSNTPWGERHCYVMAPEPKDGWLVAHSAKAMHVSPFQPMELDYEWRFRLEPQRMQVAMALRPQGQAGAAPVFHAFTELSRIPISARSLALTLVRYPFMTAKVIAAIHLQALRLWIKGVPVHDHPPQRHAPHIPISPEPPP